MPLKVSALEYDDIPEFAILDEAANENWAYARAMETPGIPRRVFVEKWTRETWGKDKTNYWVKATDTETGEMVSVALWRIPVGGEKDDERADEKSAAENEVNSKIEGDGVAKDVEGQGRPGFLAEMARMWRAFESQHIGNQPYALLAILMTHPKHQRRGAGSLLVQWGCEKADEMGLLCALTASEVGESVYAKNGFQVLHREVLDLTPYGIEGAELRRRMVRPAKDART
jgi:GNAT superfamily N-acetyltransferase